MRLAPKSTKECLNLLKKQLCLLFHRVIYRWRYARLAENCNPLIEEK